VCVRFIISLHTYPNAPGLLCLHNIISLRAGWSTIGFASLGGGGALDLICQPQRRKEGKERGQGSASLRGKERGPLDLICQSGKDRGQMNLPASGGRKEDH
jgi:hypothetical protein